MSLNGHRGHFIDNVEEHSRAEQAGLKHGDLVLEINGTLLLPLSHDEVVQLIKQLKDDPMQSRYVVRTRLLGLLRPRKLIINRTFRLCSLNFRLRLNVISSPILSDTVDEEVNEEG